MKKKILIVLIVILLFLILRFAFNKIYVNNYDSNNYSFLVRINMILNYPEPYVAYYNYGNSLYLNKNYEDAISYYEKALNSVPTKKECYVITNLSMAMFGNIDTNTTDRQELISKLKSIQDVLTSKECAKETGDGRDDSAQALYDSLEEMINKLSTGSSTSDIDDNISEDGSSSSSDIKDKLLEAQKDASKSREESTKYEDISTYKGKKW